MGKNYYVRLRKVDMNNITKLYDKLQEYCRQIVNDNKLKDSLLYNGKTKILDDISDNISDMCDKIQTLRVHLGKRNYGWQFDWDHNNGKYYDLNLDSIKLFVNDKCGGVVYDENGQQFTWDVFITDEIGSSLYLDENHCNGEMYYKNILERELDSWNTIFDKRNAASELNTPPKNIYINNQTYQVYCHDFQSLDGLKFSEDTDFS